MDFFIDLHSCVNDSEPKLTGANKGRLKGIRYHIDGMEIGIVRIEKGFAAIVDGHFRNFTKVTNSMKKFLIKLGVKKPFLDNIEHRTLGYSLNDEEAPKRLMYKFKKDIFGKLKEDYGI